MKDVFAKWAVVTGASSGIGENFAKQLAQEGLNLILVARREDRLQALAQELKSKSSIEVEVLTADLSEENSCREIFTKSTAKGRKIHVLINNAGSGFYGPFLNQDMNAYKTMIKLNVLALTELSHYFLEHMKTHGEPSYLTNIASVTAYHTVPHFNVYGSTKHYVHNFTLALAAEYKDSNIHITCVNPGATETEFIARATAGIRPIGQLGLMKSSVVASMAIRAMKKHQTNIITGCFNWITAHFLSLLPKSMEICLSHRVMESAVHWKPKA